jgi:hypothetical protein
LVKDGDAQASSQGQIRQAHAAELLNFVSEWV